MRKLLLAWLLVLGLAVMSIEVASCNAVAGWRDTIATSFGYITWAQATYGTSCKANPSQAVCVTINHAIGANNAAVDALDAYCGGPPVAGQLAWTAGGPCSPIKTLEAGLAAAISALNPVINDMKLLATGKNPPKASALLQDKPNTRASLLSVRMEGGL